ncbi:hypothetical protein R3P38DRAFT_3332033 [Favolaschia claudopus]|uniref:Transmembrane protein n=1 Tax=Favolaschia claudopus TaxID=2862362 RepID=A0AAV9ZQ99_9AGAR
MSAATLDFGAPLDNTMLLGVVCSAVLYGISVLQCFYYMSHHNAFATGFVLLLVLATGACGTVWVVLAFVLQCHTYQELLKISALTITINALSTAADIFIAVIMVHKLVRNQHSGLWDSVLIRL